MTIEPVQASPDGIRINDAIEIFTGEGHVRDILKGEVACTVNQRVNIHIRNLRH